VIAVDTIDFNILKAISDLKVPYPRADKINALVKLNPEELGTPGSPGDGGLIKTQSDSSMSDVSLPSGISAAGLTNQGRRALAGPRW
jgi:hypothetical protein